MRESNHEIEVSIISFFKMLDKIQAWVKNAAVAEDYLFAVECQRLIDTCMRSFYLPASDSDSVILKASDEVLEKLLILLIYTVSDDDGGED